MANADDRKRFDDALATLLELAATESLEIYKGHEGVLEWLAAQPNAEVAKGDIGTKLSLGYHWTKSPAITVFRETLRALMLVNATRFAGSKLKALKGKEPGNDPAAARRLLVEELKTTCSTIHFRKAGHIVIQAAVYRWAGIKEFPDIALLLRNSSVKGAELLRTANVYFLAGGDRRGFFRRWFGEANMDVAHLHVKRMLDAYESKPLSIGVDVKQAGDALGSVYGSAGRQKYETFLTKDHISIALGDHFFGKTGSHSTHVVRDATLYDEVVRRHIDLKKENEDDELATLRYVRDAELDDKEARIMNKAQDARAILVKQRIVENAARLPAGRADEKISVTGVILHEVTHNVIGTTDVDFSGHVMYGADGCLWLAKNHPNKAAINADNFRLFFEEFLPPPAAMVA